MDLFSVILEGALSWGVHRILDSIVECNCGRGREKEITNVDYNMFRCQSCSRALNQYVNANDHTVNRNGTVIAAAVGGIHWPSWRSEFKFYYDLHVINSKNESIVVEAEFSEFHGSPFHKYEYIQRPSHQYSVWNDTWISIPSSRFPDEKGIINLDLKVYNTWGDLLDIKRKLLDWSGRNRE